MKPSRPPRDLIPHGPGRAFWKKVCGRYVLRDDEYLLLGEICRTLDTLAELQQAAHPLVVDGRPNPVVVEIRLTRESLRKAVAQLGLPDPLVEGEDEPVVSVTTARTWAARRAARARWG